MWMGQSPIDPSDDRSPGGAPAQPVRSHASKLQPHTAIGCDQA